MSSQWARLVWQYTRVGAYYGGVWQTVMQSRRTQERFRRLWNIYAVLLKVYMPLRPRAQTCQPVSMSCGLSATRKQIFRWQRGSFCAPIQVGRRLCINQPAGCHSDIMWYFWREACWRVQWSCQVAIFCFLLVWSRESFNVWVFRSLRCSFGKTPKRVEIFGKRCFTVCMFTGQLGLLGGWG